MAVKVVATAFGGPEVLSVVETEIPPPGPGEVTVSVRAAGVNPVDYKLFGGGMGAGPGRFPMPVGLELAGVVTAVGPGAEGPAGPIGVGDEVVVFPATGAYADTVTAAAATVVPRPPAVGWPEAGGILLVGATAVHALGVVGAEAGETLLVHGAAGSVGQVAVQLAVAAGVTVVGTAAEPNHELLRGYGAIPVTYGAGLAERVRAVAGDTVDAAIDCVGTDEAVDTSIELVADRARIVSIAAGHRADTGIRLIGRFPGADPGTDIRAGAWRVLLPAAAEGRLRIVVARTYALSAAAEAIRFVQDGHAAGKVVLLPDSA
ncbi:MAG TPA: NADP-dependent oxidoreductase [Pseudonocardia sp.]|jgi:NADPH:quinone reductase-like Zn-dependent oxidoreductase